MIAGKATERMAVASLSVMRAATVSSGLLCIALHMAYAVVTQNYASLYRPLMRAVQFAPSFARLVQRTLSPAICARPSN